MRGVILVWLVSFSFFAKGQFFGPKIQRVLFLGNSITYAGGYVQLVDAYARMQGSGKPIEIMNLGLPSETVSGLSEEGHAGGRFPRPDLHERLARVLDGTKPDLVIACYGMNDGIYQPLDAERFQKFKEGIQWLHVQVAARGIRIVHLTPTVYEDKKDQSPAYAGVLDVYSKWLKRQSTWEVIDPHFPMKKFLEKKKKKDPNFSLAADGVHIGELGHALVAREIIEFFTKKSCEDWDQIQNYKFYEALGQEHRLMKDAWLRATGHLRPDMKVGLPMEEAMKQKEVFEKQINALRQ